MTIFYIRSVTTDNFYLKVKGMLLNKSLKIDNNERQLNLAEKKFRQNFLEETTFI